MTTPPVTPPPLLAVPTKRIAGWKIGIAVILLLGVMGVGAMITIGLLFYTTATQVTVTEEERKALHSAADLLAWHDFEVDPAHEIWTAERLIDGSGSIDYEYDDPKEDAPYLNASLHHEPRLSDAMTAYTILWQGVRLGTGLAHQNSVQIEDADHLFRWGDASRLGYLTSDGERYGMVFCTRKDRRVYLLILSGIHLEQPADLEAFLTPKLEAMMKLELGKDRKPKSGSQ